MVATSSTSSHSPSASTSAGSRPTTIGGPPRPEIVAPPIVIREDPTPDQTLTTFLALNSAYSDICSSPELGINSRKKVRVIESENEVEEDVVEEQREATTTTATTSEESSTEETPSEIKTKEEEEEKLEGKEERTVEEEHKETPFNKATDKGDEEHLLERIFPCC